MSRTFQCRAVPNTWLEHNGRRLDCGPYMSGAIEAKELLKRHTTDILANVTEDIFNSGREGRIWVDSHEYGVPFMGSTAILASDLSSLPLISKKQVASNPKFTIRKGWTLITRSGTIGRMAYARPDMDGVACSEDVMRVVPKEGVIKPGYLYAYLSSRFGVPIVVSGTYGAIIQHIEPHHIANLPVPRLGIVEEQAHELVQQAADLLSKHQKNINDATRIFFESVGLNDISTDDWHCVGSDIGFSTNSGELNTLRALNFNPRFKSLCKKIMQGPWRWLSDICVSGSLKRGGRYRRIEAEPEHSYLMVGQKQIFWLRPEGRWIAKTYVDKEVVVEPGTILIAGAGTLADSEMYSRCEFIWGEANNRAYSELFYRVLANEDLIQPGSLYAFMRSETAFRMLRSISFGSKLQYPHPKFLPNLPIPYPPQEIREKTHELMVTAYEMKDEAIKLEDEAKLIVESAIEYGAR